MTGAPSKEQIGRFLKCFDILAQFDVEQRTVRGYGAGCDPHEWPENPDADVLAVKAWLEDLAGA
jgi:hypothetical protein